MRQSIQFQSEISRSRTDLAGNALLMPSLKRQQELPGWSDERPVQNSPAAKASTPNAEPAGRPSCEPGDSNEEDLTPTLESSPPPESLAGKSVWVVDSHSLIFQVFHALPEMTSPSGQPVGAVFGFTRDVLYLLEEKKPDYLFCAFDMSGPTFRHEMFAAYKETRSEMPGDLRPQFKSVKRMLDTLGVPVLGLPGYEADDILATVARITAERGGECVVVSGDKDCRQLLNDRVRIFNVRKNQFFDAAALEADWGIRPEQVIDYQALVGDPVDNVPGVPLIGPKLAREMLQKYGTLDNLLAHAEEIAGEKRRHNLIQGRQQALLSRELARLKADVSLPIDWNGGRAGNIDPARAATLFAEFGFHSLTEKMRGRSPVARREWIADYRAIDTPEKLRDFAAELALQPCISLDTETTSISPRWAELVGFSFSWKEGEGYYLPVRAPDGESRLDLGETLATLRPILENPAIRKIGQNIKYDVIVLRSAGIHVARVEFDSMVASYLIDAGERNHNLDELAARYLQHETTKISQLIGTGKQQKRMDEVPVSLITHYAAEDADMVWRLRPILAERLKAMECEPLYDNVEIPLVEVLAELEHNGIKVDAARLAELSRQYGEKLEVLEEEIYALAGRPFNIGSPKQLQQILFEEQKLPRLRKTKTGASTDADVLEELARLHPLPAKIIEHRQYCKLKNTYVDALPQLIHPATGRVHTSFNQSVAATGRLSSSDPNLQNIPVRSDAGREIRSAFLPGYDGWKLLAADYSQIELRVLAHFSGDETLLASFARDEDIHARVASQVFAVPLGEVTSDMRRVAKAVNFGVIYGQSPFGLSKMLGIDQVQAAEFIRAYFAGYPGVSRFLESVIEQCRHDGFVRTILGRRRIIRGLGSGGPGAGASSRGAGAVQAASDEISLDEMGEAAAVADIEDPSASAVVQPLAAPSSSAVNPLKQRSLAERTAINTVIQGSAADLIKLAMINTFRRMKTEGLSSRMLLQIHDELMFEASPDEIQRMIELVRQEMSKVMELRVPLKVDVKTGSTWADCEPV